MLKEEDERDPRSDCQRDHRGDHRRDRRKDRRGDRRKDQSRREDRKENRRVDREGSAHLSQDRHDTAKSNSYHYQFCSSCKAYHKKLGCPKLMCVKCSDFSHRYHNCLRVECHMWHVKGHPIAICSGTVDSLFYDCSYMQRFYSHPRGPDFTLVKAPE